MKNSTHFRTRIQHLLLLVCAMTGSATHGTTAAAPANNSAARPNVLVILADDLGYADLNIDAAPDRARTPRLNELARQSIRFTRFYTESTCSPSRAALLTGIYPSRIGYQPNGLGIPPELTTLPEAFRAAGYRTHQIGKWHLGHLVREAWPDAQGFDTWLGFLNQWLMTDADREQGFHYGDSTHLDVFLQNEKGVIKQYPGHLTDATSDEAIRIIENESTGKPWFMYLAYFAPHGPIEPRADYAAKFPDTPAGHYAALVAHLDDRIGDVLRALDATGQRERTIVVFASDNGGTNFALDNYGLDNNAPFKGRKMQYREGGIRTPLLISWPGAIPTGRISNQVASIMDIYPTLAQLAKLPAPAGLDGRTLLDGTRAADARQAPRTLFWDMNSNLLASYSVLSSDGRWRLYQPWMGGPSLFDLQADPASATDIAAQRPDIVRKLLLEYQRWKTSAARIDISTTQRDAQGHAVWTGDDLQRAVTFGGFTVALGITPAKPAGADMQTLIEQKPALDIASNNTGLRLQLHGLSTTLPALPAGRCSSLVITGAIGRRVQLLQPEASTIDIYLDGKKVHSFAQDMAYLAASDLHAPTYVGFSATGYSGKTSGREAQRFDGALSTPIYLNVRADGAVPPALSVQALSEQVCEKNPRTL